MNLWIPLLATYGDPPRAGSLRYLPAGSRLAAWWCCLRRATIPALQIFHFTTALSLTTGSLPQSRWAIRIINQATFSSSKEEGLPKQLFPNTNFANLPPGFILWEKLGNRLGQRNICVFPWHQEIRKHVCEPLSLWSGTRIFIYCWKCTPNTFQGYYLLLQAEETRAHNSS